MGVTLRDRTREFLEDRRGVTAIILGFALLPTMLAVWAAVDYSRLSDAQSALQRAVDAGALAAARTAREKKGDPAVAAEATVRAAFGRPEAGIVGPVQHEVSNGIHRVAATAELPTRIVGIAGDKKRPVSAVAQATFGGAPRPEPREIVIVVDVSASMTFGNRWAEANKAISTMLESLKGDGSQDFFVTLVPMSDRINVSSLGNSATSWMDGKPPADWNGCLEPRERAVTGFPHALDDERPTAKADKFVPTAPGHLIPNHVGRLYASDGVPVCPRQAITGPTHDVKDIETALGALSPGGTGRYDEGMAWGWRVVSERWQGQWKIGNSYPAKKGKRRKLAILVTDGNTAAYEYEVGGAGGGSFGWNRGSRMGFEHLVHVCGRMKAEGIDIHVVQTGDNSDFTPFARQCATSADTHYRATNVEAFAQAFRSIAGGGGGEILRLVR